MLKPVFDGGTITAGNASQLSDGASACVVMEASDAAKRGLEPLGYYRGMAVAGCPPDEMGIGPVFAVPKLLGRFNLTIDDIAQVLDVPVSTANSRLRAARARLRNALERSTPSGVKR